jgi:hypothetical protein
MSDDSGDTVITLASGDIFVTVLQPEVNFITVNTPAGTGVAGLWTGSGAPGVIIGSHPGDEYLDLVSGEIYTLA